MSAHKSSLHKKNKGTRNERACDQEDEQEEGLHNVVETLQVQQLQDTENAPLVSIAQSVQNPWIDEDY